MAEGALWPDWAMGAKGAIGSEGAMKAVGTVEDERAAIHMGQFLQDGENGQNVAFFWNSALTKQFEFFNLSQFLRRHMPVRF